MLAPYALSDMHSLSLSALPSDSWFMHGRLQLTVSDTVSGMASSCRDGVNVVSDDSCIRINVNAVNLHGDLRGGPRERSRCSTSACT